MKFLILFSCALALTSAGYQAPYYGPQHVPVIGPNGVPVDTPAVQQATATHLAALAAAGSRGGHYGPGPVNQYNAPVDQYSAPAWRQTPPAYQTSHVTPAIAANGVPLDTPEVEAAKANHFAAYGQSHAALAQAAQAAGYGHGHGHYRKRRSLYAAPWVYGHAVPVIGPNGVPLDTPEVQHAKAAHLTAHAEASARAGHLAFGAPALGYGYAAYPQHVPIIDNNGVPVDTPEVQHARAAHFAALNAATARGGVGHLSVYGGPWAAGPAALIGHNGAPLDTPEVQAAKAAHFAAHAAVRGHHY